MEGRTVRDMLGVFRHKEKIRQRMKLKKLDYIRGKSSMFISVVKDAG